MIVDLQMKCRLSSKHLKRSYPVAYSPSLLPRIHFSPPISIKRKNVEIYIFSCLQYRIVIISAFSISCVLRSMHELWAMSNSQFYQITKFLHILRTNEGNYDSKINEGKQ